MRPILATVDAFFETKADRDKVLASVKKMFDLDDSYVANQPTSERGFYVYIPFDEDAPEYPTEQAITDQIRKAFGETKVLEGWIDLYAHTDQAVDLTIPEFEAALERMKKRRARLDKEIAEWESEIARRKALPD